MKQTFKFIEPEKSGLDFEFLKIFSFPLIWVFMETEIRNVDYVDILIGLSFEINFEQLEQSGIEKTIFWS